MPAPAAAAPTPRPDTALALVQPPAPVRPAPPAPARPSAPDPAIVPQQPAAPDPPADPPARRRRRAPRGEPTSAPEPATTLPTRRSGSELNLKIEVLVWAADPKQRMIYLNGLKYVEGSKLEGGAVLEQIIEDGIVLIHNGQRIRVKVGDALSGLRIKPWHRPGDERLTPPPTLASRWDAPVNGLTRRPQRAQHDS